MPFYESSEQFYNAIRSLFDRVQEDNPKAAESINKAKLLLRFNCSEPDGIILINGRRQPASVTYGENKIRPEVDVKLKADTLHYILLGELGLAKALANKDLKVHGPVRKVLTVTDLFHECQMIYPDILRDQGLTG